MKILKYFLINSIFLVTFICSIKVYSITEVNNLNEFKEKLKSFGYMITSEQHTENSLILISNNNVNFVIYDEPLHSNGLIEIKISEEVKIYQNFVDEKNYQITYFISKDIVEKNQDYFTDYIQLFPKFPSNTINILNRIRNNCIEYNLDCDIPLKIFKFMLILEETLNSNNIDISGTVYYLELTLTISVIIIYLILRKFLNIDVSSEEKVGSLISNDKQKKVLRVSFVLLVITLTIDVENIKLISILGSIIIIIFTRLKTKDLIKIKLKYILPALVIIFVFNFIKYNNLVCKNYLKEDVFVKSSTVRLPIKLYELCKYNEIVLPQNINYYLPLVINNTLIYHPKYSFIKNLNNSGLENLQIKSADVLIYSDNDNEILNFIIQNKDKIANIQSDNHNSIITKRKNIRYNLKCINNIEDEVLNINQFEYLGDLFTFKEGFSTKINCIKDKTQRLEINYNYETNRLINFQESENFDIQIESEENDNLLNLFLYSNSIQIVKVQNPDTIIFIRPNEKNNYSFEWTDIDKSNNGNINKKLNIIVNDLLKDFVINGRVNINFSSTARNPVIFNQEFEF